MNEKYGKWSFSFAKSAGKVTDLKISKIWNLLLTSHTNYSKDWKCKKDGSFGVHKSGIFVYPITGINTWSQISPSYAYFLGRFLILVMDYVSLTCRPTKSNKFQSTWLFSGFDNKINVDIHYFQQNMTDKILFKVRRRKCLIALIFGVLFIQSL